MGSVSHKLVFSFALLDVGVLFTSKFEIYNMDYTFLV